MKTALKALTLVATFAAIVFSTGCAGALGWKSATELPRGSYRHERREIIGDRGFDDCGSMRSVPAGYQLVPITTANPCGD